MMRKFSLAIFIILFIIFFIIDVFADEGAYFLIYKNLLVSGLIFYTLRKFSCNEDQLPKDDKVGYAFLIAIILVIGSYTKVLFVEELQYECQNGFGSSILIYPYGVVLLLELACIAWLIMKKIFIWYPVSFYLSMYLTLLDGGGFTGIGNMFILVVAIVMEYSITLWLNLKRLKIVKESNQT